MDIETPHRRAARPGVLLVNLGTPAAPTPAAIRAYLREFLSDRRVVELFRPLWLMILYAFILPFRPRRLAHSYAQVWMPQGSPLLVYAQRQRDGVARRLAAQLGEDLPVALAMTYGEPSIAAALSRLEAEGTRRLVVLPLYPQYSATTHAAAYDVLFALLRARRWVPELHTINGYHDHPGYIRALADSLRAHWNAKGVGDHLLVSFHSIPRSYLEAGDPYYCFCHKTARLLAAELGLAEDRWTLSFQSRLGNQPWLQPYSDLVIPQLAQRGVKRLDVLCPGFSADCLETLEEVALRYAQNFVAVGGEALRYVPALNDDPAHLDLIADLCAQALGAWRSVPSAVTTADERLRLARRAEPCLLREDLA